MNTYRIWCIPPKDEAPTAYSSVNNGALYRPVMGWHNWVTLPKLVEGNVYKEMLLVTAIQAITFKSKSMADCYLKPLLFNNPKHQFIVVKFTETMHRPYKTKRRKKSLGRMESDHRELDIEL